MKFRQSYNQANAAISPGSGGGVQGGLQGHCHVLLLEFALLACLLAFRCANLEQSFIFAKCFATLLVTAVLVSYFLAFWACFMPPRRTTRNSLNSFFDMAELANSTADVPVSSALPASIPPSGDQANVLPSSASSPALSVETLTASILSAIRPLLASASGNQSLVSSLPATPHTDSSNLPLAAATSLVTPSSAPQLPAAVQSPSTGRPIFVPSFVNTFTAPAVSSVILPSSLSTMPASIASAPLSASPTSFSTPTMPALQQPFIVGPGFSPVPYKLVSQIISGKFIDLAELLSDNLRDNESEPQLLFDGRLVLTSTSKRLKRSIDDITAWSEAFSIYSFILASHYPSRWRDLTLYKLLILRTNRQFQGNAWLAYDRAFREHAAAARLTDWSSIDVQLFNFHAAGSSVRRSFTEPNGSSSAVVCRSWNNGFCVAPSRICRFAHRCSVCSSNHRASECSQRKKQVATRSPSPETSKRRKRH